MENQWKKKTKLKTRVKTIRGLSMSLAGELNTDYKKRYSVRLESLNACIVEAALLEDAAAITWLRVEITKMLDRINKSEGS